MIYWLYYYFNRHIGEWVLDIDGTAPYYHPVEADSVNSLSVTPSGPITPTLATISEDRKTIYLVIANGSWDKPIPCNVDFQNFEIGSVVGTVLSNPDPDGKPLLERKDDVITELPVMADKNHITCTIPEHSVVFLMVLRK
jgi:hypothetical protein